MSKVFGFGLLWWLTGNPFVALLILLVILYVLERRFVGFLPSVTRPIRIRRRLRKIRQELALNPHHNSLKSEAARILIELKRYGEAKRLLDEALRQVDDSADLRVDAALCRLKLGELAEGEAMMLEALRMNPRVRYGEPYLRLGEAFAEHDREKALGYLQQFGDMQSSSCEAYYRLGVLLQKTGKPDEAKRAFREAADIYRSLPRYKKRSERRWALLARLKR
jgi:tetratricopeptide (TPR) repeat protein